MKNAPFGNITLTNHGWQELRNLTPEAVALKELTDALDDRILESLNPNKLDDRFVSTCPVLVSALQEARVLVRRMGEKAATEEKAAPNEG